MHTDDTISAIITALGTGAVGIIRISGDKSIEIAEKIFVAQSGKYLSAEPSHKMSYGKIKDENDEFVDEVLAVCMKNPHSYTAEDVVEIQCHGGVESLKTILSLTYKHGARPAEPGEFTKRAFLNGRIDLAQAEAVMDIINSRSEASLKLALRQQEGFLSKELKAIREELMGVIVNLEAVIDYPEDDIEDVTYEAVEGHIRSAQSKVEQLLKNAHTGKILREGLKTVIVGRPNVGKSSLLNALLKEDRAIVSEYAGTTRDVIEEQVLIGDVPLVLTDTAGIRETEDFVEKIGVDKSKEMLEKAELAIIVVDGMENLQEEDLEILKVATSKDYVIMVNKVDLGYTETKAKLEKIYGSEHVIEISAKTKAGLDNFIKWLENYAFGKEGTLNEGAYVQNARHEDLLIKAAKNLEDSISACENLLPYDCVTIDVQAAINNMGEITGQAVRDEIINEIFAKFCVGK